MLNMLNAYHQVRGQISFMLLLKKTRYYIMYNQIVTHNTYSNEEVH